MDVAPRGLPWSTHHDGDHQSLIPIHAGPSHKALSPRDKRVLLISFLTGGRLRSPGARRSPWPPLTRASSSPSMSVFNYSSMRCLFCLTTSLRHSPKIPVRYVSCHSRLSTIRRPEGSSRNCRNAVIYFAGKSMHYYTHSSWVVYSLRSLTEWIRGQVCASFQPLAFAMLKPPPARKLPNLSTHIHGCHAPIRIRWRVV